MAPTRAEIADIMGFQSKNAASDHLRALERKGFIKLHSDRSRGIQLLDNAYWSEEELPIVGKVAAEARCRLAIVDNHAILGIVLQLVALEATLQHRRNVVRP